MLIYTGEKWVNVAGDAGFEDGILTVGGDNDRKIVIKDSDGEVLGTMSREGIELNNAKFNNLESETIVSIQRATTYYVNDKTGDDNNTGLTVDKPFKTIYEAILRLKNKKLIQSCNINIAAGVYNENLWIEGISGAGILALNFEEGVVINGLINVTGCSNMITLIGNKTVLNQNETSLNYAITANFSSHLRISSFNINGQATTQYGVLAYRGATISIKDSSISNITNTTSSSITAYENSMIYIDNVIGSNNYRSLWSASGSVITATNKIPKATVANLAGTGQIFGNPTQTPADGVVPVAPTKITKTVSFEGTGFKFWRTTLAKWQAGVYIGDFSKSTSGSGTGGNNLSVITIDMDNIRSKLRGKNITSVKATIQRKTSGGYDSLTTPYLGLTTSTATGSTPAITKEIGSLGTYSKGQSKAASIPVSTITNIINNTSIKSFILYRPDQKQYSIFENKFVLTVTYEEDISLYLQEATTLEEDLIDTINITK